MKMVDQSNVEKSVRPKKSSRLMKIKFDPYTVLLCIGLGLLFRYFPYVHLS